MLPVVWVLECWEASAFLSAFWFWFESLDADLTDILDAPDFLESLEILDFYLEDFFNELMDLWLLTEDLD